MSMSRNINKVRRMARRAFDKLERLKRKKLEIKRVTKPVMCYEVDLRRRSSLDELGLWD
jgi:hypothetical protein